jgi:hypothetical protein
MTSTSDNTDRRIALLLVLPSNAPDNTTDPGMRGLRRFLKALVRSYGIRCISIKRPSETVTFAPTKDNVDDE